jgi:hypothetical protein
LGFLLKKGLPRWDIASVHENWNAYSGGVSIMLEKSYDQLKGLQRSPNYFVVLKSKVLYVKTDFTFSNL